MPEAASSPPGGARRESREGPEIWQQFLLQDCAMGYGQKRLVSFSCSRLGHSSLEILNNYRLSVSVANERLVGREVQLGMGTF